jgi:hypothetical protein
MTALQTAQIGIRVICDEITRRGGQCVHVRKEGNRYQIAFVGKNGNSYTVSPRTKRSGTWQTSITYGEACKENLVERDFWVFVDIGCEPPRFYPVPAWWIANDIYEAHQRYLKAHGGHRKDNDNSTHHAIAAKRIESWKDSWDQLGLG